MPGVSSIALARNHHLASAFTLPFERTGTSQSSWTLNKIIILPLDTAVALSRCERTPPPPNMVSRSSFSPGVPLVFTLDKDLKPITHEEAIPPLSARYLGDVSGIRARIEAVKAQTK